MERLTKSLTDNGFAYKKTSETAIRVTPNGTMTAEIKLVDNEQVDVTCYDGYYYVTAQMEPEKAAKWIRAQSPSRVNQALMCVGVERLHGWTIHENVGGWSIRKVYGGAPPPVLERHHFDSLEAAAQFIADKLDGGDLMRTQAVTNFIRMWSYNYTLKDSWYVSNDYPSCKFALEPGDNHVDLVVNFAGSIVRERFARAELVKMRNHGLMEALRVINNIADHSKEQQEWITAAMQRTSNYAEICAALAAIGYIRKDTEYPGTDDFESKIAGAGLVCIRVEKDYCVTVTIMDSDEYKRFPLGTAPEVIIEWIGAQQPWYNTLIELQAERAEFAAAKKAAEEAKAEAEATKKELEATKNLLAQVRAAVE